jgi:CIC family chloride channel protein
MKKLNKLIDKFIIWKSRNLNDRYFLYLLSLLIGIITGLAAVFLKTIVHNTSLLVNSVVNIDSANFAYFTIPLLGITLTLLYLKYFVKDSLSHGVSKVLFAISMKKSKILSHNNYSSIIASTLTVGFGGSVGLEAPVVLTGSSIGANLAQKFNLDYRSRTLLLGCGAAAAVASIFKAPIAGTIFVIEVLMLDLSVGLLIPLLLSAVTGSIVSSFLLGQDVVFNFAVFEPFQISNIFLYILLGVFCGLIGLYFTRILEFVENKFVTKIKTPFKKLLIGGILLGILIYFFPPLYGEGYETLSFLFSNNPTNALHHSYFLAFSDNIWFVLLFFALVIIFKAFAVAFTTGAGGIGGVFAPSLFLGGVAGFLFSGLINSLNIANLEQRNFALVGMAGVMSAVMHAPLTAIFLIAEITGGYMLFIPIIITATVAFLTIHKFEIHSIYTKQLARTGELLTHDKDKSVLTLLQINDLIENDFKIININAYLGDLIVEIANSKRNTFAVVDDENHFLGLIFLDDIRKMMFDYDLYDEIKIVSIMNLPPAVITKADTAQQVMAKFEKTHAWNLPVVDDTKYIGFLSKSKVLSSYRELLIEVSHDFE